MKDTAEKIMQLFRRHGKVKAGMVLTSTEFSFSSSAWEPTDFAQLEEAVKELIKEGYVILTPSRGLELTEEGYNYLLNEP